MALGDMGVACGDEWNIKSLMAPGLENRAPFVCLVQLQRSEL